MQIEVSGHQIDVTPALREYAQSKFGKISRHFEHVIGVHVVLGVEKLKHKAAATITLSQKTIHAEADANDMYAAIDGLADRLDRQVKEHKEKLTDHNRAHAEKLRAQA